MVSVGGVSSVDDPAGAHEQRSSVKLTRNAKGEPQWEIKVLAGDDLDMLDRARKIAVDQYRLLERDLGSP